MITSKGFHLKLNTYIKTLHYIAFAKGKSTGIWVLANT